MSEPVSPAVEPTVPPAAPVQEPVSNPPQGPTAEELAKKLSEKDAELAKVASERDNYRTGLINLKDRMKKAGIEDEPEQIDVSAVVDQKLAEHVAPLKAEIEKLSHVISESARAASAHASAAPGGAAGQKVEEPTVPKLTPAEEALLARRGLTAKDVKVQ